MQYNENNIQRPSASNKLWQFIRFVVITGIIFAVSFFALNFQAYKTILGSLINPEAQQERGELLAQTASEGGEAEIDESLLLPILNDESEASKSYEWVDIPVLPTDNRLVIPKTGQSVPLVGMNPDTLLNEDWDGLEKEIQSKLKDGVLLYPETAKPGEIGNTFITGHSSYYAWDDGRYKDVFSLLGQLEVNDQYFVYYDQQKYTYQITEKKIVTPEDTTILMQPNDKRMSTLMTCWPVGTTTSRLAIVAEDVSQKNYAEQSHTEDIAINSANLPALPF